MRSALSSNTAIFPFNPVFAVPLALTIKVRKLASLLDTGMDNWEVTTDCYIRRLTCQFRSVWTLPLLGLRIVYRQYRHFGPHFNNFIAKRFPRGLVTDSECHTCFDIFFHGFRYLLWNIIRCSFVGYMWVAILNIIGTSHPFCTAWLDSSVRRNHRASRHDGRGSSALCSPQLGLIRPRAVQLPLRPYDPHCCGNEGCNTIDTSQHDTSSAFCQWGIRWYSHQALGTPPSCAALS